MKQKIRYTDWVGRTETTEDVADESKVARMYATLNAESPENLSHQELPNLWHWMYFSPIVPFSDLGGDGHPKRGNFLPPVDLPRRMWAGGRLEFFRPLQVGQEIARTSTIKSVQNKNGRTGEMVFVTVSHEVSDKSGMILIEEQDIVLTLQPDYVNGMLALSWNDDFTNETNWYVEKSIGTNQSFFSLDTLDPNTTSYFDFDVIMYGAEYYYRVYAENTVSTSAMSNEVVYEGLGVDEMMTEAITIFPNPTNSTVSIKSVATNQILYCHLILYKNHF